MESTSFNLTDIRLQSALSFNITNSTVISRYLTSTGSYPSYLISQDSTVLTVQLGQDDLFTFKRYPNFASSPMTTYLSYSAKLVSDMNSNPIIPVSAQYLPFAYSFYPDNIRPELLAYTLNLTSEQLVLTFSDIVNTSSLYIDGISIQSDVERRTSTQLYVLSPNSSTHSSGYDSVVTIYLGLNDLNEVKKLKNLAANQPTTYLTVESRTIQDMNGNYLIPIDPSQALAPSDFSQDTTHPILLSFALNMEQQILTLNFSETVFVDTLSVSELTLQSTEGGGTSYTLSDNTVTVDIDGPVVTLLLDEHTDVDRIKLLTDLAQSSNTTFLSITSDFITDSNSNRIIPIPSTSGLQVLAYTSDTTGPYLEGFDLDMDSAVVTLSFNEPVSFQSLVFTRLRFHSDSAGLLSLVNVSNGTHTPPNGLEINFTLTFFTLSELKLDRTIATLQDNTYVSIISGVIYDLALVRNPAFELTRQVTLLTADTTSPNLLNFYADLNAGVLTLNFDEVVDSSSLDPAAFTLINSQSPNETHVLTGGNTSSSNGLQILLSLTVEDVNVLKQMEQLYTRASNSYLTFSSLAISDMSGNPVTVVPTSSALIASFYVNDTTRPILRSFDFDLNSGQVTLNFYETVDISTLRIDQITFQQSSHSSNYHTLTGGYLVSTEDDTSVKFNLTLSDLNRIKALRIALTPTTTWLTLTNNTIRDMNNRKIVEIINGYNARLVEAFTVDTTDPVLQSYDLSMNASTLVLYFSETVNALNLLVSEITLLPSHNTTDTSLTHTLTSTSYSPIVYSPYVLIYLSEEDSNEIKRLTDLAISVSTTFLSITAAAIPDMSGNAVVPISEPDALPVTNYTPDNLPVVLRSMDFDLNQGIIQFSFSEPVLPSTLNISQFLLLSRTNITLSEDMLVLNGTATTLLPTTSLQVQLTNDNLNEIKRLTYLATSLRTTHISVTRHAIQDTNNNYIVPISPYNALQAYSFVLDYTSPVLVRFDLNLSDNKLTLYFDETVNAFSLSITELTFFGTDNLTLGPEYSLRGGVSGSPDGTVIVVNLTTEDLNALKQNLAYYISDTTTYVFPTNSFISDMSGNPLSELSLPLSVSTFVADSISPTAVSATLDMDTGVLVLYYDEVVLGYSLDVTEVYILSRVGATSNEQRLRLNRTLGSGDQTGTEDVIDSAISIQLGSNDLNELKRLTQIATNINNSYVSFSQFSIIDTNENQVISQPYDNPIKVSSFTRDTTRPRLLYFSIDMDSGLLNLTFDETVNVSSLLHTEITLQADELHNSATQTVSLNGGTTVSIWDSIEVRFILTDDDLNRIKFLQELATDTNNTFISITNHTIRDMSNNYVWQVSTDSAIQVTDFYPDNTNAILTHFTIDMDAGRIWLYFSETVNASSLFITEITLQDYVTASSNYTLTDSTSSQTDSTSITVYLSFTDLNAIKSDRLIITSILDTYLSFPNTLVRDMNYNQIDPRPNGAALKASNFTRDNSRPFLDEFSLDMNTGILELTFSEAIDTRNTNVSQITLQSNSSVLESVIQSQTLINSSIIGEDSYIIPIQLEYGDINRIKQLTLLATSLFNTYIYFPHTALYDFFNNPVLPITSSLAKRVLQFTEDETRPNLISARLNLNNDLLILTFSEMVNKATIQLNQLTLYNSTSLPTQSYQLTTSSYSYNSTYNGVITLIATLSLTDTNQIKSLTNLATGVFNTYISITELLIEDMNQLLVYNISQSNAIPLTEFTRDNRSPVLQSFDLDLDSDILTLYFSETVDFNSFEITGLTLLNLVTNTSRSLTSVTVLTQQYTPVLHVKLHSQDLDYIKIQTDLATNINNTFISADPITVLDMNRKDLIQIPVYSPLQVTNFISDFVRPNLTSFSLDLNTAKLTLTFSESVNVSSLSVSHISLQNSEFAAARDTVTLTYDNSSNLSSFSDSPNQPYLTIQLGSVDLNLIKLLTQLATHRNNTYLRISQFSITDMNANRVNEIQNGFAILATNFTQDKTNPELTTFSLDMDTGVLHLTFSETVNTSSLRVDAITLLNQASSNFPIMLSLSGGTILTTMDSTMIDVEITKTDLDTIKRERGLADAINTTYLAIQYQAVFDMNVNPLTGILLNEAIRASVFTPDTTPPTLLLYYLDTDVGLLTLSFSETVETDSLRVNQLTLQNSPAALRSVTLSNTSSHLRIDSTVVYMNISFEDLNRIKLERSIASVANGTNVFLTYTKYTIQDMNNNFVVGRSDPDGLGVTQFTPDTTNPTLLSFNLDVNSGVLNLTFSEVVDALTYNVTSIQLQQHDSRSNNSEFYRLSTQFLTSGDGLVLSQTIQRYDLNNIKTLRNLAISDVTTYISIDHFLVRDMNQNPITAIATSSAKQVDIFTGDITRPVLENSTLDMDVGLLVLYFDESMDTIASLDVTQIGFSSSYNGSISFSFSLQNLTFSTSPDIPVVEITIGESDLNELKRQQPLAIGKYYTYISLSDTTIKDTSNNFNQPILTRQITNFIEDKTRPELINFQIDLTLEILTLFFSETVSSSSLDVTQITFVSQSLNNTYTLLYGRILSPDNTVLTIELNGIDLNYLKLQTDLLTTDNNTLLSVTSTLIQDINLNYNQPIPISSSLMAGIYTADTVAPQLLSYTLDMNYFRLELTFDEPVLSVTLNTSLFTILPYPNAPADETYKLTSESRSFSLNGLVINIEIGSNDANRIKYLYYLAQGLQSTYLSFPEEAIQDMNMNPVLPIRPANASNLVTYVRDSSSPILLSFSLDLSLEILRLTFDETINVARTLFSGISLQPCRTCTAPSQVHRLTSGFILGDNSTLLILMLAQEDLHSIKLDTQLATNTNNTYIHLLPTSVQDMATQANYVADTTQVVTSFTQDTVSPNLLIFLVDLTREELTLIFDEPVNTQTLNTSAITLLNGSSLYPHSAYTLTGGWTLSLNGLSVVVRLTPYDVNQIKLLENLLVSNETSFLSITRRLIVDMNGNQVVEIATSQPLPTSYFLNDSFSPYLIRFDIDMDTGHMVLYFQVS